MTLKHVIIHVTHLQLCKTTVDYLCYLLYCLHEYEIYSVDVL